MWEAGLAADFHHRMLGLPAVHQRLLNLDGKTTALHCECLQSLVQPRLDHDRIFENDGISPQPKRFFL